MSTNAMHAYIVIIKENILELDHEATFELTYTLKNHLGTIFTQ